MLNPTAKPDKKLFFKLNNWDYFAHAFLPTTRDAPGKPLQTRAYFSKFEGFSQLFTHLEVELKLKFT